jgi:hypothetical protein
MRKKTNNKIKPFLQRENTVNNTNLIIPFGKKNRINSNSSDNKNKNNNSNVPKVNFK